MKIAVVTDSGSNYFNENIAIEGLFAVPLQIIDQDHSYLESVEISLDDTYDSMEQHKSLTTSLPPLGIIEDLFESLKASGYDLIFATPITSGLSGTINAMVASARHIGIDFDYVDCFTTFHNALNSALAARKLFDQGFDVATVKARLESAIAYSDTIVIPNDLKHLARGGRLSPMAAALGGLLRIKPILHLNPSTKGVIEPMNKVRTMSKAIDTVVEHLKQAGVDANYHLTVAHVRAMEDCESVVNKLKVAFPKTTISVRDLISTVSVHTGLGTIALQFMKKIEI